jgi:hypothetical protein
VQLARSFAFHLLAPYAAHLVLALLLIHYLSVAELAVILFFGGWIALLGIALISIPFGVLHVLQTIYFAPSWRSSWRQFLTGLLNPSFAVLTIVAVFYFNPDYILNLNSSGDKFKDTFCAQALGLAHARRSSLRTAKHPAGGCHASCWSCGNM